jgi:hypothetical protein
MQPAKAIPVTVKSGRQRRLDAAYDEWNFAFITPRELPSMVNHARVIDTDGYLYTFNTLDPTFWMNSINEWPEYAHGYGVHFNKVKNPPVHCLLLGFLY